MKQKLGVSVDIFASPSEGDFQSQLQLFEDLSNKITKVSPSLHYPQVNLVMPVARAWKKGIYLDLISMKKNRHG